MADGVKLASGYVELTVKKAGNAMKEITAEITGVGKQAEKVGKQAGDAIDKGISKGATKAGKTVQDAIKAGAEKGGEDAGKAAGDAIDKGVRKGATKAGETVREAINKGAKQAGDDVGKTKIEPKVEPKVETHRARDALKEFGKDIVVMVDKAANDAGITLEGVITGVAREAGKKVGQELHDAISNVPYLGDAARNIEGWINPAVDGFKGLNDAVAAFKDKDAAGALNGLATALDAVWQTKAGGAVKDVADKAAPLQEKISSIKGDILGVTDGFLAFAGNSGRIAGAFSAVAAAAAPIAATLATLDTLMPGWHNGAANVIDQIKGNQPLNVKDWVNTAIPGTNLLDSAMGWGHPQRPAAPSIPMTQADKDKVSALILPPGRAKGGVAPSGRIYGPGTGTSDSIIGIGEDGLPTARVSTGEGVVKKAAMDRGGAAIVAALNGGMKLPGYDDGTNNVGGPPIPLPAIQVPPATTGQAGALNDLLARTQGHKYEYGTLYDCSGYMSQIYNAITGKQMPRFNTESDLAAYGFVRGSKPGTFQLGIHHGGGGPNSHMAGTLPDGRAVESAANGVQIGAGAHGAFDPQFEDHWYLPGSERMGGASGGGGAPNLAAMMGGAGGATGDPASMFAAGDPAGGAQRTQGYIPAGAGGGGQAGTSLWSGAMQMGASAVNQVIDQAASAASTAISAAATAGSFGAGGQAGAAASQFAIGIGTAMAKRGVQYGFQMAGIGGDALAEILLPFGVPRFFQTDPSQFMPQLPGQAAGVTTGEKAEQQKDNPGGGAPSPTGPVQPGQMPGQQVVGQSVPLATEGTGDFTPAPSVAPALSGQSQPPVATPQPNAPAVPTPGVGAGIAGQPPAGAPPAAPTPTPQQKPQRPPVTNMNDYLASIAGLARGGVVPGKFDDGGWLMPGGVAINKTNRPEPILNADQWGDLHAIAAKGMPSPDPKAIRGGDDYSVRIESVTVSDVEAMRREIDSRQRLQMMRFAGRP